MVAAAGQHDVSMKPQFVRQRLRPKPVSPDAPAAKEKKKAAEKSKAKKSKAKSKAGHVTKKTYTKTAPAATTKTAPAATTKMPAAVSVSYGCAKCRHSKKGCARCRELAKTETKGYSLDGVMVVRTIINAD